jgi:hypothetical protein
MFNDSSYPIDVERCVSDIRKSFLSAFSIDSVVIPLGLR